MTYVVLLAGPGASALAAPPPQAIPELIGSLNSDRGTVRDQAIAALAAVGPEAIPALISALKPEQARVCSGAVAALGKMGGKAASAADALRRLRSDGDPALQEAASEALANILGDAAEAAERSAEIADHWADQAARVCLERGDQARGNGDREALAHYLAAMRLTPRIPTAAYRAACIHAQQGRKTEAAELLAEAVKRGYWQYGELIEDELLGELSDSPEHKALLKTIRDRYAVEAPKHVGAFLVRVPEGPVPAGGWPVFLLLHGYRSNKDGFAAVAELCAERGFIGVAVSGPKVVTETSFHWPKEGPEPTHTYLQGILAKLKDRKDVDLSRVYVGGFSEGGLQSLALIAAHPEAYRGALVHSPGGFINAPTETAKSPAPRPVFVIYGKKDPIGNWFLSARAAALARKAGWPVETYVHDGGHHFPRDWWEVFGRAMDWLAADGRKPLAKPAAPM